MPCEMAKVIDEAHCDEAFADEMAIAIRAPPASRQACGLHALARHGFAGLSTTNSAERWRADVVGRPTASIIGSKNPAVEV